MTLQNGLIYQREGYLWVDTGLFEIETGKVIGHAAKAFQGTTAPWAAVHSGFMRTNDPHRIARTISQRLLIETPDLLKVARDALREDAADGLMGRLLLCWPDPEFGARMMLLANEDLPFAKAYEPHELVQYASSLGDDPAAQAVLTDEPTPDTMRRYIDLQCDSATDTVAGWSGRSIAGNIIELKINAHGVTPRIIRENVNLNLGAGDRVGERIEPYGSKVVHEKLGQMQQQESVAFETQLTALAARVTSSSNGVGAEPEPA